MKKLEYTFNEIMDFANKQAYTTEAYYVDCVSGVKTPESRHRIKVTNNKGGLAIFGQTAKDGDVYHLVHSNRLL